MSSPMRMFSLVQQNNVAALQKMIDEGVSPCTQNRVEQTALHIACLWGNVDCAQVLIKAGADVNATNRISGGTPLHCASMSKRNDEGCAKCIRLLMACGADGSKEDFHGREPWHYSKDPELRVVMSASCGADGSKEDFHGREPWHYSKNPELRVVMSASMAAFHDRVIKLVREWNASSSRTPGSKELILNSNGFNGLKIGSCVLNGFARDEAQSLVYDYEIMLRTPGPTEWTICRNESQLHELSAKLRHYNYKLKCSLPSRSSTKADSSSDPMMPAEMPNPGNSRSVTGTNDRCSEITKWLEEVVEQCANAINDPWAKLVQEFLTVEAMNKNIAEEVLSNEDLRRSKPQSSASINVSNRIVSCVGLRMEAVKEGDRVKVSGLTSEEGLQLNGTHGIIMEVDPKDAGRWVVSLDGMERPKSFKATQLEKLRQEQTVMPSTGKQPDQKRAKPSLEDFTLVRVLGKGSFGKVTLVRGKKDGNLYAMKVLSKPNVLKRKQVEHTKTERRVLGGTSHPFVNSLHCAFQTSGKLYLVLNYCAGGELFFHLQKRGKFTLKETRFYAAEISLALSYLHTVKKVVYRDLKPENILLDLDGHVQLCDFGLAKYYTV